MRSMRVLSLALALLVSTAPVAAAQDAAEGSLDVIVDSTQHWLGTNDVLLSVYDASSGASLADEGVELSVRLTGPEGGGLNARPAVEQIRDLWAPSLPCACAAGSSWACGTSRSAPRSRAARARAPAPSMWHQMKARRRWVRWCPAGRRPRCVTPTA